MAPPDRSRRKRHGKSPRKRFGSGKSTPSSPSGTPTRFSHTQKVADVAEGASAVVNPKVELKTKSDIAHVESQHLTGTDLIGISYSSEEFVKASTSATSYQNCVPEEVINENIDSLKTDSKQNIDMSSDELHKLNHLCGLLENIVIAHRSTVPSVKQSDSLIKKQVQNEERVVASESVCNNISEPKQEKTREEIELERKLRKEAKKAKKKGGNKENVEDAIGAIIENKQVDVSSSANSAHKLQQAPANSEIQKNNRETPKLQSALNKKTAEEDASGKSKADLRRERREKQEAQRKAKMEGKAQQDFANKQKQQPQQIMKEKAASLQPKKKPEVEGKQVLRDKKSADRGQSERRIPLLDHLMAHASQPPSYPVNCEFIHPAVRTLGIKMKEHIIDGSTARVISMLAAFKRVISDYQTPESCDLSRDLAEKLLPNISFLHACRPQNIAMDNAVRFLKHEINSIRPDEPEAQAKDQLRTAIDEYIRNNIILASSTIASHASQVIKNGDVILTFGYSALVSDVLEAASHRGDKISVVVADSPHPPSGATMVKRLADLGVTTYYRLITEVSHIMNKVTKVIVEAEAVMMNGAVQGLCGTASLALEAATHDTPFIVLCHTYKFCNNDLTDSLVFNELGDTDSMVFCASKDYCNLLENWRETPNLNVVSLVYDVTPANLVTALITEQNVLPTSAVPVIIRRNYADILGQD